MNALTVFYDAECGLCSSVKEWLGQERCYVPLRFMPYDSVSAAALFPGIKDFRPAEELLVMGDDGGVYRGGDAWIMCLWATVRYREWSLRLAGPGMRNAAAQICHVVSRNRQLLSRFFRCRSEREISNMMKTMKENGEVTAGTCRNRSQMPVVMRHKDNDALWCQTLENNTSWGAE